MESCLRSLEGQFLNEIIEYSDGYYVADADYQNGLPRLLLFLEMEQIFEVTGAIMGHLREYFIVRS